MITDSLHDSVVASLARQAVELLAGGIRIDVEPEAIQNSYGFGVRRWVVWPLIDGARDFGISLESALSPVQALARLVDTLSEYSSETTRWWGVAFPACPGHAHPARTSVDDRTRPAAVVLTCPDSGVEVRRVTPLG